MLFTCVFGGAISGSTGDYLTFALPGIIVINIILVTLYVGMGLNTDLTKGVFDRLRALPVARWAQLACRISADLVKQAWSIVLLIGGSGRSGVGFAAVGRRHRSRVRPTVGVDTEPPRLNGSRYDPGHARQLG